MMNGSAETSGTLANRQLRTQAGRLKLGFLEAEIQTTRTLASMSKINRALGYLEAANRGMAFAQKGCRMAIYLLGTLHDLDAATRQSLLARIEALRSELDSPELPDWFLEEHPSHAKPLPSDQRPSEKLTRREREVLRLVVEGESSKEIAAKLGISFKTAVCHRTSAMNKLGVQNTASLVRRAILGGLV